MKKYKIDNYMLHGFERHTWSTFDLLCKIYDAYKIKKNILATTQEVYRRVCFK